MAKEDRIDIPDLRGRAQAHWRRFALNYEEDGVYIEAPADWQRLDTYDDMFVQQFLAYRGVDGVDLPRVLAALRTSMRTARVAGPQEAANFDEDVFCVKAKDNLEGVIMLLPPGEGGSRLSYVAVEKLLSSRFSITVGYKKEDIEKHLSEARYFEPFLAALGVLPQKGEDAKLEYFFDPNKKQAVLTSGEDGKVDYRDIQLFESATKGQLLIRKTPAAAGVNGLTISGEIIPAVPGKDVAMPSGKNVELTEDRLEMYSQLDGRIDIVNKRIIVSNVMKVSGNADLSVGNIDFNGDVIVNGNVITGMRIRTTGSIEVHGTVEAAHLEAGADIVLHRGMQAAGSGTLKAGGSIVAQFIERAAVEAGENVSSDSLLHCTLSCNDSVLCKGRRGIIVGGDVRAGREITASSIGSDAYVNTQVYVGVAPQTLDRMRELEEQIKNFNAELDKCDKAEQALKLRPQDEKTAQLSAQVALLRAKAHEGRDEAAAEYEGLLPVVESAGRGKVNVREAIYPGAIITIGSSKYTIRSKIEYATFRLYDKEVVFDAYEGI